jgi:type VI secretion system protein ImpA
MMRRNALNNFSDQMAIVEGLRRTPIVSSRQHGVVSLRDLDTLRQGQSADINEKRMSAAFAATPPPELAALLHHVTTAVEAVQRIDRKMRETAGADDAPSLEGLLTALNRIAKIVKGRLGDHPDAPGDTTEPAAPTAAAPGGATAAIGAITSREDAVRALDAVADFFRRTEPSSPVPLFVMRAKRLVAKDFLEVLADVAPDAVASAKLAGGLREEQG